MSTYMDTSDHGTNGQMHRRMSKNRFPWGKELVRTPPLQVCDGRDSSKRLYSKMDGRRHHPGNVCSCIISKVCSCPRAWTTFKMPGKKQNLEDVEKLLVDAPTLLKLPLSEGPDIWIRLPRCRWPKNQWCLSKGICTDILLQVSYGKDNSRRFTAKLKGESINLGMCVCSSPMASIRVRGWHQHDRKEREFGANVQSFDEQGWSGGTNNVSWLGVSGFF